MTRLAFGRERGAEGPPGRPGRVTLFPASLIVREGNTMVNDRRWRIQHPFSCGNVTKSLTVVKIRFRRYNQSLSVDSDNPTIAAAKSGAREAGYPLGMLAHALLRRLWCGLPHHNRRKIHWGGEASPNPT